MEIHVSGMDPSLTNWGIAECDLNLENGFISDPLLTLIEPKELKGKQVRVNSNDLYRAEQLASVALLIGSRCKIVFIEVPHGSQSARAMASYGICIGIIAALRANGIIVIEVNATENKFIFTGNKNATKDLMIKTAFGLYPNSFKSFPRHKGELVAKAEHVSDAIAAIHAGVQTPEFKSVLRLLGKV